MFTKDKHAKPGSLLALIGTKSEEKPEKGEAEDKELGGSEGMRMAAKALLKAIHQNDVDKVERALRAFCDNHAAYEPDESEDESDEDDL